MAVGPGPQDGADERTRAVVAELWDRFSGLNEERVRAVEDAAVAQLEGRLDADTRAAGRQAAHKLAGSLGTFGISEGTRLARVVETLLGSSGELGREEALTLSELVVDLRSELERAVPGAGTTPGRTPPAGGSPGALPALEEPTVARVVVASPDEDLVERLRAAGSARGLAVRGAPLDGTLPALAQREMADLVVVDVPPPSEAAGVHDLIGELTASPEAFPVAVLTATGTLPERLEVARRGARAFLPRTLAADAIASEIERMLSRERHRRTRVLAVDDDPVVLSTLTTTLGSHGFEVSVLPDPLAFWVRLEEERPDLVILDIDMPGASGLDLCRVLRSDPRWSSLPVLFLTAATSPDAIRSVFAAGADDFVPKPVVEEVVVGRIRNRLERVELSRRLAETDPLTGLSNRVASERAIGDLLRAAEARRRPVGVGAVKVDGLADVVSRHGHAAGDELLRRLGMLLRGAFSGDDVAARWGGGEFVVAAYGADAGGLAARLEDVGLAFAAERVPGRDAAAAATVSCGVAAYPDDGETLLAVLGAASEAGSRAKAAGPGAVEVSGGTDIRTRAERLDVLVVEDDPTIEELLVHSLSTRGYRTKAVRDGVAAVEALSGPHPPVRATVVLLDVELPGMDGLSVLRRLSLDGVLAQTRVVMLTGRAGEDEVLEALSTGAFDHVAKPFSVPILLERVRRALET